MLGILKSAHEYIQLSNDTVITNDDTTNITSYEFGSGVIGVNLVDKNGQPVSVNQKIVNITFDFVLKVRLLKKSSGVSHSHESLIGWITK